MSARETMSRPDAQSEPETTQPLDMSGMAEDDQHTVEVSTESTVPVRPGDSDQVDPALAKDQARERRRAERERALGTRPKTVDAATDLVPVTHPKEQRTTDRFLGSVGLFVLRLVAAAIIGLHGFAKMLDLSAVQNMLANTIIPQPVIMSYVLTGAEIAIALALVFGLLTRLAGAGLAAIGIGALVFVLWTSNPFTGNQLTGELELLLGAVGLLFLCVGGGGWSIDRAFRRRRDAED